MNKDAALLIPLERVQPELGRVLEAAKDAGEMDAIVGAVRLRAEDADAEPLGSAGEQFLGDLGARHASTDNHQGRACFDHAHRLPSARTISAGAQAPKNSIEFHSPRRGSTAPGEAGWSARAAGSVPVAESTALESNCNAKPTKPIRRGQRKCKHLKALDVASPQ